MERIPKYCGIDDWMVNFWSAPSAYKQNFNDVQLPTYYTWVCSFSAVIYIHSFSTDL